MSKSIRVKVRFRFHTGSIKRFSFKPVATWIGGFDSILVRLKDCYKIQVITAQRVFRFHTGSIKRSFIVPLNGTK